MIKFITFIFTLILISFSTFNIFAQQRLPQPRMQQPTLQEIINEVQQLRSPEDKLRTFVESGRRYLRTQPDSLRLIIPEIEKLEGISGIEKEAFSYFLLADYWRNSNRDSTIYYAEKASVLLKKLGDHTSYISAENLKAIEYTREQDYVKAELIFLDLISYIQDYKDQTEYPVNQIYANLGRLYNTVEADDLAIEMFEKFFQGEQSQEGICPIIISLSSSYLRLDQFQRAKELLEGCIGYPNFPPPFTSALKFNLGIVHLNLGDTLSAIPLLQEASALSRQYRLPNQIITQPIQLGRVYLKTGSDEKADSIKSFLESDENNRLIPQLHVQKLNYFSEVAFAYNDFRQVLSYSDEAIRIAELNEIEPLLLYTYELRSKAYQELDMLELALESQQKQNELDRLRVDRQREKEAAMASVRLQLQSTSNQLEKMSSQISEMELRTIAIIAFLLIIGLYAIHRYRNYYALREEHTRTRIARDLHDDLSGTLSSISLFSEAAQRGEANNEESKRFLSIIDKNALDAKEKINDIIWAVNPSYDDWPTFLAKCKRFASDTFDSNNIEYDLDFDDDFYIPVNQELRQNLWLIFKESINNLVIHSQAPKAKIKFKKNKNNIELIVSDNGIGFNIQELDHVNGLNNIKYRAKLINGEAKLSSKPNMGTTWKFKFKLPKP